MKQELKFGLSQVKASAPGWMVNATSLLALAIAAKHYLIGNMPMVSQHAKLMAMEWVDYLLDLAQVLMAVAVIFTGKHKTK